MKTIAYKILKTCYIVIRPRVAQISQQNQVNFRSTKGDLGQQKWPKLTKNKKCESRETQ